MLARYTVCTLVAGASAYSMQPVALSRPALRVRVSPTMVHADASSVESVSDLMANAGAIQEIGPTLYAQLGVSGAMIAGGFGLNAFADVPEPEEFETPEGEIDIYRDSPLRFLGYANEVGEAFRPLVPVELVYFSYFAAISYILADTVDKGRQGAKNGVVSGVLGAVDTFSWQMLASVLFPSFIINRFVCFLASANAAGITPEMLQLDWLPTAAGLITIPLVIVPLDILAHFSMNGSFRKAARSLK